MAYRWIAFDNWTYATSFTGFTKLRSDSHFAFCFSKRLLYPDPDAVVCVLCINRNKQKVLLVFDGVDTVASICLNGITFGKTDNMFRRYVCSLENEQLMTLTVHHYVVIRLFEIPCFWCVGLPSQKLTEGRGKCAAS